MKREVDSKVVYVSIGAIVLIAVGAFVFFGRGQGDRTGPKFDVDFHSANGMKPRSGLPGGWKPGMSQNQGQAGFGGPGAPPPRP